MADMSMLKNGSGVAAGSGMSDSSHRPTLGSLFAGIGGLDLGFARAGFETVWQVEINAYCRQVLARHFPEAKRYGDIRECGAHNLARVDVICGGFPCQPVSLAGKQRAQSDERWLWPEFFRVICELRPRFVLVENVPGLLVRGMGDVLGDLASIGMDAEWESISAADAGAPHIRERVWIVAYPVRLGHFRPATTSEDAYNEQWLGEAHRQERRFISGSLESDGEDVPDAMRQRLPERDEQGSVRTAPAGILAGRESFRASSAGRWQQWEVEPDVGRVADGIPARVDRLRGLGNAVVPQIAEWIARRFLAVEQAQ